MSSCSLAISDTKRLFEGSKRRAEALMKTMQVTKEGEVLSQTVAVADRAIEILNAADIDSLPLVDRRGLVNSIPAVVVRTRLKDVFKGAIGRKANSKSPRKDLVMQSVERVDDTIRIKVTPKGKEKYWTYIFEPNSNVSNNTNAEGNRLYIPHFAETYRSVEYAVQDANSVLTRTENYIEGRKTLDTLNKKVESESDSELLGSTANASKLFNYKRAREIPHDVHGSISHIKNLLGDLHAMTDNSVDSETYKYYNKLLGQMHEHFFVDMNIYINENAEHTQGWVDLDKKHILLNVSSTWFEGMSNEEVYMHEVIHAMTVWGLNQEGFVGSGMRARLNYLRNAAYKSMTWQSIHKANPKLTEKEAQDRFDYIFNSKKDHKASDEEFLAFALTNPSIMSQLEKIKIKEERKPGLLNAIFDFFGDVMNAVMGNYSFGGRNSDVRTEIHTLAFKIAEINANADAEITKGNLLSKLGDLVDFAEGGFEELVHNLTSKLDSKSKVVVPENPTKAQKVMFLAKFFTKGIYNKQWKDAVGILMSHYGVSATNSIREIGRSILPQLDDKYYEAEREGLKATSVDNIRNLYNTASARSIIKGFKTPLIEKEELALTSALLESNGSVLFKRNKNQGKGYTTKQIAHLLADAGMRKRTIARLEAQVKKQGKARGNWVVGQANGLGKLMATGKGHEAQATNSKSIVLGYGSNERFKLDNKLLSAVEELASLRALDYQNITELRTVANLLMKEEKGVRNIVNLYNNFKKDSAEELFADDPSHMLEGYVKELFDDTIEVRYEPLSDKDEMEKKGFTLVSEVTNEGFAGGKPLGVYVSKSYTQAERLRGSVNLGNPQSRGLSLKDIRYKQFGDNKKHAQVYFEHDKITLNKKAVEINKRLAAGEKFDSIEEGAIPIMNATGKTVDYRKMMDKHLKAKFLKQDRAVSRVLSRTSGTVIDKLARAKQNDDVLNVIKDHLKNYFDNPNSENNLEEYTLIGAEVPQPELRRLFNMLPKSYQDLANSRADKVLPIPSVLMHQYFGYTHYRFTDIPGINRLPESVKHILNIMEAYWMDLVKIAKGNILLKMPIVLVTNIVSNILYAINTGTNPLELVGQYRDSIRDVKAFMAAHKEVQELKIELASLSQDYLNIKFSDTELEAYNEEVSRLTDRIARLELEMSKNEVKELFDIGMYQSVIEDIEMYKLGDTNKVSDGMDKLMNKLPTMIKTPLQVAYLSKETAWYKVNQEVLQLSDLVARDVMNRKQKKIEKDQADGKRDLPLEYRKAIGKMTPKRVGKPLTGYAREQFLKTAERSRHANLLNSFVNYQLPNGKGEEYLNRIGILMFTKYLKRIQHVITTTGVKHPIRTATTLAAASFFLDVDMVQDQALLVKGTDDLDSGILGIVPLYSPVDILLNVATPALVKLVPGI